MIAQKEAYLHAGLRERLKWLLSLQNDFRLSKWDSSRKEFSKWIPISEIPEADWPNYDARQFIGHELVLDLDAPTIEENQKLYERARLKLLEYGLGFETFDTHSKGLHVHLFFSEVISNADRQAFINALFDKEIIDNLDKEFFTKGGKGQLTSLEFHKHFKSKKTVTCIEKTNPRLNSFPANLKTKEEDKTVKAVNGLQNRTSEEILNSTHPSEKDRVALVMNLREFHNWSADQILQHIKTTNKWTDFNEEFTQKKIESVLKAYADKPNPNRPTTPTPQTPPTTNQLTIDKVKNVVSKHFPDLWTETEVALSNAEVLRLSDINEPSTVYFTGASSSGKTTILSFFYNHSFVFKSDCFTPKSFVSHASNIRQADLEKIDLLPKLKDKIFVTPELAPLFKKQKEELAEIFGLLARVLDGEGLASDSGTRGHRGYSDTLFVWLGATTPLSKTAWKIMSLVGHRILFVKMDSKKKKVSDYVLRFITEDNYKKKLRECRTAVHELLTEIKEQGLYEVNWNRENDKELFPKLVKMALLVSRLRADVSVWTEKSDTGESVYNYSTALPEEPDRLITALYALARGRALLYNRNYLTEDDISMVFRVGLSSMPYDRSVFVLKLIKHKGRMLTEEVETELKCTKATALKIMRVLEVLEVVDSEFEAGETKKTNAIKLKPEFSWILEEPNVERLFEELRSAEENARKEEEADKKKGLGGWSEE